MMAAFLHWLDCPSTEEMGTRQSTGQWSDWQDWFWAPYACEERGSCFRKGSTRSIGIPPEKWFQHIGGRCNDIQKFLQQEVCLRSRTSSYLMPLLIVDSIRDLDKVSDSGIPAMRKLNHRCDLFRFSEAVNGAQKLRFIPFQSSEAEEKANCLKFVDKSLSYVLSDLLLIYVKALVSKYQENPMNPNPSDQLAGIAAFARLVPPPFVVAKEVFREIVAFGWIWRSVLIWMVSKAELASLQLV